MACQEDIDVFQSITGADLETAEHCLEAFEGNMDRAVSHFLDARAIPAPRHKRNEAAARANGSTAHHNSYVNDEDARMPSRAGRKSGADTKHADPSNTQQRNQSHIEEEAALQEALAASTVTAGNGATASPTAPACNEGATLSHLSIDGSDSEEEEEYEPEVDSDVEMDTEEEYLEKMAVSREARLRLAREAQLSVAHSNAASSSGRNVDLPDLPAGIDLEEARMVESAMLGVPYTGRLPDFTNGAMGGGQSNAASAHAPVSPAVQEQRSLREEQDWAYKESLQADQKRMDAEDAKAAADEAAARAESIANAEAKERQRVVEQAHAKRLAATTAALSPEPPAGTDVVTVAVKLPDGQRLTRRFLKISPVKALYDYVDVRGPSAAGPNADFQPGTYLLVASRPRKVHQSSATQSLADAHFEKQEMLMLEPLPE